MPQTQTDSDEHLVGRLIGGDPAALDALFRRYYVELCRIANRYVRSEEAAEDIVQEFFAGVWEKRGDLPRMDSAGPYLRRSVRNRSLNYLRDQKRIPIDDGEVPETVPAATDKSSDTADLRRRIHRAIDQLPERCRLVFTMSKIDDMSHREIAERLDISTKTVENQMTRAYRYLRQWLAVIMLICLIT